MRRSDKKENLGITLVALVITIIVLLILAGVAVATLTGENGILNRASTAKNMTEEAGEKEKEDLSKLEDLIEGKARDGLTEEQIRTIIRGEIANANKEEVLWTNPNPTTEFTPQTVTWTSTEYNRFFVVCKEYTENANTNCNQTFILYPGRQTDLLMCWNDNTAFCYRQRKCTVNSEGTSATFSNTNIVNIASNSFVKEENGLVVIPLYIIGYKSTLNL